MDWQNVSRRCGTLQRLASGQNGEMWPVTEHTYTFFLGEDERFGETRVPFFTGVGATPEEAEERAYSAFLRAENCSHVFVPRAASNVAECRTCRMLLRLERPDVTPATSSVRPSWWQGLLRPARPTAAGAAAPGAGD
ncbi:hypothetical protein [Deinococcus hopiensis]|uniref:Uncharacterized protein n=1 Tax=Deinococcus hopiensis KR-140 TaxID=695939 RepID=A0A1W1VJX8_9DEIO|nr:hypothetical protein [Deinococcus hopiensis]SMB93677.1 hypothetical protein SAMN00790413_02071 [Deinococcus hopiensis KR-140]